VVNEILYQMPRTNFKYYQTMPLTSCHKQVSVSTNWSTIRFCILASTQKTHHKLI